MGGWSLHGRAWYFIIPHHLQNRAHINLLQFMASLIGFWIDIIEESIEPQDCILSGGNSSTAMGWLRRTNFREEGENNQDWVAKQQVGRKVATLVIKNELVLYCQWIAGVFNILADSLSRDALFLNESSHLFLLKHIFDK